MSQSWLIRLMNLWPPLVGAGIRVAHMSKDMRAIDVSMRLRAYNRNYVGVHFGGSLYAMTDPFYMLMLMQNLGKDFVVWDKGAVIDFKKPGTGKVTARFRLSAGQIDSIREAALQNGKTLPEFDVVITNEAGETVATVRKILYVRCKQKKT